MDFYSEFSYFSWFLREFFFCDAKELTSPHPKSQKRKLSHDRWREPGWQER